ncbi:MAG: HPr family phosphocarrier protein [Candidatus Zixiibacteriota bacterium]|nr:MAG: HPr family phosphocarrier protein [candidate division Zixibacteria bacterium]
MVRKSVRVINRLGMHARPAAAFVSNASRFASEIFIEKDGLKVNGKSIMGVMMLAAEMGSELSISAEGEDEEEAVEVLVDLVRTGFGDLKDL